MNSHISCIIKNLLMLQPNDFFPFSSFVTDSLNGMMNLHKLTYMMPNKNFHMLWPNDFFLFFFFLLGSFGIARRWETIYIRWSSCHLWLLRWWIHTKGVVYCSFHYKCWIHANSYKIYSSIYDKWLIASFKYYIM